MKSMLHRLNKTAFCAVKITSFINSFRNFIKYWRITQGIPVVILQIINNFRLIFYIRDIESSNFELVNALTWLFKSSKNGFLNPPILEIKSFSLHVKSE